jgi:energy-coupling factor transporter ATP-binding protein EcfA2
MSIANYKEHRNAFSALLEKDCDKPILLFKGESGMGKSTLMKHCWQLVKTRPHLYLDFKESTTNIMQIFDKLAYKLGLDGVDCLLNNPNINFSSNIQAGVGNTMNVEMNYHNPEQWNMYLIQLTKALLKNIDEFDNDFILLMDTYENTNGEIQKWVQSNLLPSVENHKKLRVIIAGKSVPDQNSEWETCCKLKELQGVHEAEEWLPIIELMGRKELSLESLELFKCFCRDYTKGSPSEIIKFIETFPLA